MPSAGPHGQAHTLDEQNYYWRVEQKGSGWFIMVCLPPHADIGFSYLQMALLGHSEWLLRLVGGRPIGRRRLTTCVRRILCFYSFVRYSA